jgi:RNA polymerase sigma-70 factor, ECF subfamily
MTVAMFKQLFEEHAGFVWRVLRRHGVPEREVEDACQEVFLVVHRRMSEFEGRSSLRTWIYGIAVRVGLGLRRKAFMRRELLVTVPEGVTSCVDALEMYARQEAQLWLKNALAELPRAKREAFVLYELEEMTIAETATALGIPENTALYRLYGARKDIAAALRKRELRAAQKVESGPSRWLVNKKGALSP